MLLLADIFSLCYSVANGGAASRLGGEDNLSILTDHKIELHVPPSPKEDGTSRIDMKFINSPELSDVRFRVEGRIFYAHKIVLLTASPRFQSMLNYRLSSGSANGTGDPPILQINDIRYDVFALVMSYLYNGSASCLKVENSDLLELMAAGMVSLGQPVV